MDGSELVVYLLFCFSRNVVTDLVCDEILRHTAASPVFVINTCILGEAPDASSPAGWLGEKLGLCAEPDTAPGVELGVCEEPDTAPEVNDL